MKLLLDENLSHRHAALLREQGHDAVAVVEVGLSGQPDSIVRMFAIESGRILLTLDADFANLLRFPPGRNTWRDSFEDPSADGGWNSEQIEKTLHTLRDTSLVGCLAVSHEGVVRIRN